MRIALPMLTMLAGLNCLAQAPAAQNSAGAPAFEVASVRVADLSVPGQAFKASPGSLTLQQVSLFDCIQWAYDMQAWQVTGPDWIKNVWFDIAAKAAGPADDKQLRLMLRTLLADRLGVRVHTESKEMAAYALTIAAGGPKFSESTTEGPPEFTKEGGASVGRRVSMSDFAKTLSPVFKRPVSDATGLYGRYDVRIDVRAYVAAATANGNTVDATDAASIVIDAVRAQLGLRVESRKADAGILVVDQASKTPTEN